MRIVNRKTFLQLPAGTVFSKYSPCIFGDLSIKGDTVSNDFLVQDIVGSIDSETDSGYYDKINASEKDGVSLKMDFDVMGRDGLFDDDQLFAIWERDDVIGLRDRLKDALDSAYKVTIRYFADYSEEHEGWCVFKGTREGLVHNIEMCAGPCSQRIHAFDEANRLNELNAVKL